MRQLSFFRSLSFLVLCLLLSGASLAQKPSEKAFDRIKADINLAGGVYYMYDFKKPVITPAPKGYEAFYISHYGRHGARMILNEREYTQVAEILGKAHAAGQLTEKGEQAYSRYMAIYPHLKNRSGDLTEKGYQQHKTLAKRMYANYPSVFKKNAQLVAYATVVPRCILSMSAFCEALKEVNPGLDIYKEVSVANMDYLNPHSSYNPKGTEKDHEFKSSKAPWRIEHRKFFEERLQPEVFLSRLFVNLNYAKQICDPVHFQRDFFAIACHMQCTDLNQTFYDFFTVEELCRLWECDNYMFYVEKGPDPRNKGRLSALAERLLEDILDGADQDIARGKPNLRLRFGHDGCIMGLLTLMNLEGWNTPVTDPLQIKEVWQSYKIPMAANLQFIFYKHPQNPEILVRMLLNEEELILPLPADRAPYYRWADFRSYYREVVKNAKYLLSSTAANPLEPRVR